MNPFFEHLGYLWRNKQNSYAALRNKIKLPIF